ncbi:membrane-bound metal-dependent hydrolase [Paenibacillus curdlanolyticus YK9]|uniref:Membrane-bound metal-dependent hydrolase n=1 Tax=Paenibacillus curdlanolyticus YK9 TaxID=717606 RepID=E0I544_9BACL|nr:metal-dependent hydrolase [Paenibacillus curdlanolyticus]EFM12086.1 membrane-bound metal-dependent hydrolase [Paenibacillus curdlanolyticus YK9]
MDTGSHLLFGLTLAGAAFVMPGVADHPSLAHAMVAVSMIGSHAPDFDAVVRLKSEAAYLRYHRGITHSLPAPFVWSLLIGLPCAACFGVMQHVWIVLLWTLLAVVFHITLDLFNGYGVQCLRPFTNRWLHLDTLCLFDPYMFAAHFISALLWLCGLLPQPGLIFTMLYAATFAYIGWRSFEHRRRFKQVKSELGEGKRITLLPSMRGGSWQFVAESTDAYLTGTVNSKGVHVEATLRKSPSGQLPDAALASMATDGVRAFLDFAEKVHVSVQERLDGYEVTWSDVRFWYNHKMPFHAAVTLDRQMNVRESKLGWDKKTWEPPHV